MGINWRILQLDPGTEKFLPLAKRLVSRKVAAGDTTINQLAEGADALIVRNFTSTWVLDGVTIRAHAMYAELIGWVAKLSLIGGFLKQSAKLSYGLLTKALTSRTSAGTSGPAPYLNILIDPPGRYTSPLTWRFFSPDGTEWGSDSGTLSTAPGGAQTWNNYYAVAGILNGVSGVPDPTLVVTSVYDTPAYISAYAAYLASSPPAVPPKVHVITPEQILGFFSGDPTTIALLEGWSGGSYMQSWDLVDLSGTMTYVPGEKIFFDVPADTAMPSGSGEYPLLLSGGVANGHPYQTTQAIKDAWLAGWKEGLIRADEWERSTAASLISVLDAGVIPPTIHNALKSAMWYSRKVVIRSPQLEVTVFDVTDTGAYPGSGNYTRTRTQKTRIKFYIVPADDPAFDPDVHLIEEVIPSTLVEQWTTHTITGDPAYSGVVTLKQTFTNWMNIDSQGRTLEDSSVPSESRAAFVSEGAAYRANALFETYNGVCYRFHTYYGSGSPLDFLSSASTWNGGTVAPPLPIPPMLYQAGGVFSFLSPSTVQCEPAQAFVEYQKVRKAKDTPDDSVPTYLDTRPYGQAVFTLFYIDTPVVDPDVDLEENPDAVVPTLLRAYKFRLDEDGSYTYFGRYAIKDEGPKIELSRGFYAKMILQGEFTPSMVKEFTVNHAPDEQPDLSSLPEWLGELAAPAA